MKYYKTYYIVFLISLSVVIYSCKKDPEIPLTSTGFPTEVETIISAKCATSGCHNNLSYAGAANLNLTTYANLFKGSFSGSTVIPFKSDFSSLSYFINTYSELGPINNPTMPLNASSLSKQEVVTIKNWINAGAPDAKGNIMWSENVTRKKYYVLNQGCDVVTVFDAETNLAMRYITVGNKPNSIESPHMIKVSPDGKFWYVVFVANNIIQKYRTSDDAFVGEVNLGTNLNWNSFTISNDGKFAYCICWQSNSQIAQVNLQTMVLKNFVGGFLNGHGCALNKTNDTLYVTAQTGNYIYKIDTAFNNLETIVIDGSNIINNSSMLDPHQVLFSDDGLKYFVTCQASNEVRVLRTADNVLLQVIPTGAYPQEITKSSLYNKIYVSCEKDPNANSKIQGSVTQIDITTYQATNYKVGYLPHGIAVDEARNLLLVASRNIFTTGPTPHHTGICGRNGFINYFNLNTMELQSKQTEVASDPYSITLTK